PPHGPLGPACARGGSCAGASPRHRACRRARARFRARRTRGGTVILLTFVAATPSPTPTASPGAGIFSSPILLSLLIWVPVLMAVAIASMPNPRGRYDTLMKQIAFFTTLGLVFILFVAYNQFENFLPTMQYEERLDWLPAIGVKYHLGIDGPGLVMLVLSGLIGVASVLASIGVFALYAATGAQGFDIETLLKPGLSPRIQLAVSIVMIIAAATRLPLFPLHGWIRDVLAEAPPGVVVVVAGAASRLGAFLILRTVIAAEPAAGHLLSPLLAVLAALTVGYAALAALRTVDIRHAGAYLAMVPGGITILGFAAVSPLGIAGSVLSLFTGGLSAALVAGVGATLSDR